MTSAAPTAASAAAHDAAAAQASATAAEEYAQEVADSIVDGGVLSINGETGVVTVGLNDLTDVSTSGAGHTPTNGQVLTWDTGMNHWMPSTIETPDNSLDIASLPTLP